MAQFETYEVEVRRVVRVTIDRDGFTPDLMAEFQQSIDRTVDTVEQHVERLAWLFAAGRIDEGDFIEGYGPSKEIGLRLAETEDDETEILTTPDKARAAADRAGLNRDSEA